MVEAEKPEIPRHVHSVSSSGQITIPAELREKFDTDEFAVYTDDENEQIHLYPVKMK